MLGVKMKRYVVICFLTLLFSGCNGDAPALTCHDDCVEAGHYRDLFCECRKKPSGPYFTPTPTLKEGSPTFDFVWEEKYGCSLNRHYYILNSNDHDMYAKVSRKTYGSSNRSETEYYLKANSNSRSSGLDIGYEEIKVGNECFDQDFTLNSYRRAKDTNGFETAFARLDESKNELIQRHQSKVLGIEKALNALTLSKSNIPSNKIKTYSDAKIVENVRIQNTLDCEIECDSTSSSNCAIKGYPPDQSKLRSIRDKIRLPKNDGELPAADIYSIFGLVKTSCERTNITTKSSKIYNQGQYCSFPMYIHATDTTPITAIHFPNNVKGERIVKSNGTSGIAFNAGYGNPILLFTDEDLQADFGGVITEVLASDKGIYYQTVSGCMYEGLK